MTEKTGNKELDVLRTDILNLREEIAKFAGDVQKAVKNRVKQARAEVSEESDDEQDEKGHGMLSDIWHKIDSSKNQGEKVVRDFVAKVEHRPLVSIVAAFGLGYVLSKLWCHGKK